MSFEQFSGTAYSYIRFSSREQEQGDSIRRQRSLRDEWLARQSGVTLDVTQGGEDRGVSAFRGKHRTDKHHLGRFLDAVRDKRVKPGSILLLESLDRLSREEVEDAVALLLSLLAAGIVIVQLEPYTVFRRGAGMVGLLTAILSLSRAHEESAMKSARMTAAWRRKQAEAAADRTIATRRCPAWLEIVEGKFRFKPGAKETIRRIFHAAVEGQGASLIADELNREAVPHFDGPGSRWLNVYVNHLLRSPKVIGRYQPRKRVHGKRVAAGAVVEGYFPAAVSLTDWHAAQKATDARKKRGGRRGSGGWVALFGPVFCARTGETMNAVVRIDKRSRRRYHVLQPAGVLRWRGKCVSFPLSSFENGLRSKLRELSMEDVFPRAGEPARATELKERLAAVELRRAEWKAAIVSGGKGASALEVLHELDAECERVSAELSEVQSEAAAPAGANLMALSELERDCAVETDPATRLRYRAAAARLIERVDVLVVATVPTALYRLAVVQVRFRGGAGAGGAAVLRRYCFVHRAAGRGGAAGQSAEGWFVVSTTLAAGADLADRAEARAIEARLTKLDLSRLT